MKLKIKFLTILTSLLVAFGGSSLANVDAAIVGYDMTTGDFTDVNGINWNFTGMFSFDNTGLSNGDQIDASVADFSLMATLSNLDEFTMFTFDESNLFEPDNFRYTLGNTFLDILGIEQVPNDSVLLGNEWGFIDTIVASDSNGNGGFCSTCRVTVTPKAVVPEPSTYVVLATALLGIGLYKVRRNKTAKG